MLFKSFFNKDYRHYREKGEQLLAQQRYAEARLAFQESLQKFPAVADNAASEKRYLAEKLVETGDSLGRLNLTEAEHALRRGDRGKAREHAQLALELAEDVAVREKAEEFMKIAAADSSRPAAAPVKNSCAGCTDVTDITTESSQFIDDNLTAEDRFELLIQTLPQDLAERYAGLGKEFAYAYLLVHDGKMGAARDMLEEMLARGESDIIHYELSVIAYKNGQAAECEGHLRRALEICDRNSLCYLAMVHLLIDTARAGEAVTLLHVMLGKEITPDQAVYLLGEVHALLDESDKAIDWFSQALAFPNYAKAAAERLIPLLEGRGRRDEAAFLYKRYLKGCC
jgi:tetratricopeptide (TPR) repeat protein